MNIKVKDLVVGNVVTTQPHKSVGHAKAIMHNHLIHALPVVSPEGTAVGIVTTKDLIGHVADETPLSKIMTTHIFTVPLYEDVHIAARIMRNHHIHHLLVTDEQKLVGILSSFDLLRLIEDHRFAVKNPPSSPKRGSKKD